MKHAIRLLVALLVLGGFLATARAQEVFKPGNGVTLPVVVHEVKPDYTAEAKAAHIEGTVLVETVVQADGNVGDVKVVRSLDTTLRSRSAGGQRGQAVDVQAGNEGRQGSPRPRDHRVEVHAQVVTGGMRRLRPDTGRCWTRTA